MSPALEAITAYEKSDQNPLNKTIKHQHALPGQSCIKTLSQLQTHINNEGKHASYDLLLDEMGMDTAFFKKHREKPAFVFVFQPGPWFSIKYQIIINLLQKLIDYFDCNREISGVFALNNDRFTFGGLKKIFNQFYLANDLKTLHFVEKKFIEQNEGLGYPYVSIENGDARGLKSIIDISGGIVKASQKDFRQFEHYIRTLPHEQIGRNKRIDDFIPHEHDLKRLHDLLQLIYREKIMADLKFASDNINEKETIWSSYWNDVNRQVMEIEIGEIDNLLNKYVLAIRDVHKLAEWLGKTLNNPEGEPLSILNIIDPYSHKHYSVYYDFGKAKTGDKNFLYYVNKTEASGEPEKTFLTWEEITNLAEQELTGGPTYLIKYLLRAASHNYMLVDSSIATQNTKHDLLLNLTHQSLTGLPYPWITVDQPINNNTSEIVPDNESFIALYSPFHEIEQSTAIARFFAG